MARNRWIHVLPWLGLIFLILLAGCRPTRSRSGPAPTATPQVPLFSQPMPTAALVPTPTWTPLPVSPVGAPTATPFLSPLPTPTMVPAAPAPTAAPPSGITHVVQPGETLFRIALRYGTTVEAIVEANNLVNPDFIVPGQRLVIPAAGSTPAETPTGGERIYIVQPGDNLFRIGLKFNMLWTAIAARNGITNPNAIYPGQRLIIPSP